jgi:hypothetical protein
MEGKKKDQKIKKEMKGENTKKIRKAGRNQE